jgi:1-acyl-sn-glycerol-3-phosphate acyltransferase
MVLFVVLVQYVIGDRRRLDWILKLLCKAILLVFGWRVRVTGRQHLRGLGPCLFMANHVNIFDPILLYGHIPRFVRAVELEDHFSWPIWGMIVRRAGFIPISHTRVASAMRSLALAAEAVRGGTSIIILPEGHRTRNGELGRFMRGAFRLATNLGADIVPVAIRGAYRLKNVHSRLVRPGKVEMVIGAPIRRPGGTRETERELADRVHKTIAELLA